MWGGGVLLQVYLSYNNVSALKTLASQKKWRLSSEKDKVSDISLFLVDRVVLFFSFTDSLYLVLGSSLQSWTEVYVELQGGYRGGCSCWNSLLAAGRTAQQAELGQILSVILTQAPPLSLTLLNWDLIDIIHHHFTPVFIWLLPAEGLTNEHVPLSFIEDFYICKVLYSAPYSCTCSFVLASGSKVFLVMILSAFV